MATLIEEAQWMALSHPCRLAIETSHPRYLWNCTGLVLRMTVDTGYE